MRIQCDPCENSIGILQGLRDEAAKISMESQNSRRSPAILREKKMGGIIFFGFISLTLGATHQAVRQSYAQEAHGHSCQQSDRLVSLPAQCSAQQHCVAGAWYGWSPCTQGQCRSPVN